MELQTIGQGCVALNVHTPVRSAGEASSLVRAALLLDGLEPWPRMELELFPAAGGTLILARPVGGLLVEIADYALPFLG